MESSIITGELRVLLIKLIKITEQSSNKYVIEEVYLNPSHIVFLEEDKSIKNKLVEGKIKLGLDERTEFTKVILNSDGISRKMTLVGSPSVIEGKIFSKSKQQKQILRG